MRREPRTIRYTPSTALTDDPTPLRAAWHEQWYRASRLARLPKPGPTTFLYTY